MGRSYGQKAAIPSIINFAGAGVAELADAQDLGAKPRNIASVLPSIQLSQNTTLTLEHVGACWFVFDRISHELVTETSMKKLRKVQDGVFDEIVFNAIDFAKRSVAELERSPKYSMIHFAAAVELFLKARLLREHWSLVVTRPETASLPDFRSGKFHSVSMEEAIKRLRNVANEPISDGAEKAFRALADHRNRLIHFFHPVLTSSAKARELEAIASDQYKAWHFLYELVVGSWAIHFKRHVGRLQKLNKILLRLKAFLRAKYEAIASEIQEQSKHGAIFEVCSLCTFPAAKVDGTGADPALFTGRCLVCGWYHSKAHQFG